MAKVAVLTAILVVIALLEVQTEAASIRCFKRMSSKTGWFASPNHPFRYPRNNLCEYAIRGHVDYFVEIKFTKFKLERPFMGNKTDYIEIIDGGKNNRRRELTIDGSQRGPFTYTSLSRRVFVIFHSNELFEYDGFEATYKMIKRECAEPALQHVQADCEISSEGYARNCDVSCDATFVLEGNPIIYCQGTIFDTTPKCVPDPAIHCDINEIQQVNPNCQNDPDTGIIKECTYGCPEEFFPPENNKILCTSGIWDPEPKCEPRPTVGCKIEEEEEGLFPTECERDPVTNVVTKCKSFECERMKGRNAMNYVPVGELICLNGKWSEPKCLPKPEIMDQCFDGTLEIRDDNDDDDDCDPDYEDPEPGEPGPGEPGPGEPGPGPPPGPRGARCRRPNPDIPCPPGGPCPPPPPEDPEEPEPPTDAPKARCPFTLKERNDHKKAFFDDLKDLEDISIGKGGGVKRYRCYPEYCMTNARTKMPYVNCAKHAKNLQKRYKLSEERRHERKTFCLRCQATDCSKPIQHFT